MAGSVFQQELSALRKFRDGGTRFSSDTVRLVKSSLPPSIPQATVSSSKRRHSIRPAVENQTPSWESSRGDSSPSEELATKGKEIEPKDESHLRDNPPEEQGERSTSQTISHVENESGGARPSTESSRKVSPYPITSMEQHDRLTATVGILMDTLTEQGGLRALLEQALDPGEVPPSYSADDANIRLRGTLLELEKTVQKLISVRVALQQEQTRSERAERALEITLRQLNDTTSQLENSKAEAKLLQKQIRDSKGQASSTRFIEKTPPLSPSTDRQMNSFKSRGIDDDDQLPPPPPSSPPPLLDNNEEEVDEHPTKQTEGTANSLGSSNDKGDTASSLSSSQDIGKADTTIEATAVEDTSITLDIDLGNDKSSQIKVTLESDALSLAHSFVQENSLHLSYLEPLVKYIEKTKETLVNENSETTAKTTDENQVITDVPEPENDGRDVPDTCDVRQEVSRSFVNESLSSPQREEVDLLLTDNNRDLSIDSTSTESHSSDDDCSRSELHLKNLPPPPPPLHSPAECNDSPTQDGGTIRNSPKNVPSKEEIARVIETIQAGNVTPTADLVYLLQSYADFFSSHSGGGGSDGSINTRVDDSKLEEQELSPSKNIGAIDQDRFDEKCNVDDTLNFDLSTSLTDHSLVDTSSTQQKQDSNSSLSPDDTMQTQSPNTTIFRDLSRSITSTTTLISPPSTMDEDGDNETQHINQDDGDELEENFFMRSEWDDRSEEKSRASSRNSGVTADSSHGSSYYELSQHSSTTSSTGADCQRDTDDGCVTSDLNMTIAYPDESDDGESEVNQSFFQETSGYLTHDSLDESRSHNRNSYSPSMGDSQRSTDTLCSREDSVCAYNSFKHNSDSTTPVATTPKRRVGATEQEKSTTQPQHQQRSSAIKHKFIKKKNRQQHEDSFGRASVGHYSSNESGSPYSQQQLSAGSETTVPTLRFEDPLRARAEKLDPLEAAVDIFDSATTLANEGYIDDAVPLYLHALKIFENYSYDELPLIREEIWKWVSIAESSSLKHEIESIIFTSRKGQQQKSAHGTESAQLETPRSRNFEKVSEVDRLAQEARRGRLRSPKSPEATSSLQGKVQDNPYGDQMTSEPVLSMHDLSGYLSKKPEGRQSSRFIQSKDSNIEETYFDDSSPLFSYDHNHSPHDDMPTEQSNEIRLRSNVQYETTEDIYDHGGSVEKMLYNTSIGSSATPREMISKKKKKRGKLKHQLSRQLQSARHSLVHVEGAEPLPRLSVFYDSDEGDSDSEIMNNFENNVRSNSMMVNEIQGSHSRGDIDEQGVSGLIDSEYDDSSSEEYVNIADHCS